MKKLGRTYKKAIIRKRRNRSNLTKWQILLSFVFGLGTFVIAYVPILQSDVQIGNYIYFRNDPNIILGVLYCVTLTLVMWKINLQIIAPINNHWITRACGRYYHESKHYFPYDQLSWIESQSYQDIQYVERFFNCSVLSSNIDENNQPNNICYDLKIGISGYLFYIESEGPIMNGAFDNRYAIERLIELGLLRNQKRNLRPTNS